MKTQVKITDKRLKALKSDNELKNYVIDYLLQLPKDERLSFMENLSRHGCVSGMVSGLIYYSDTNKFFDQYQDEIYEIATEQMESFGESDNLMQFFASLNGAKNCGSIEQEKNLKAWYGFEEMARIIANDLEIEL